MKTKELLLTGMAFGGEAIGRDTDGRMIFVPFALPEELVRVELVDERKRWARAKLLEVLEPSPNRINPRCGHFGVCGGCHYQHIAYPDQLLLKTEILCDQLERIGGIEHPNILPAIPAPEPWYYRNRIRFSLTEGGGLGFVDQAGSQVFEIQECHLPSNRILEVVEAIDVPPSPTITSTEIREGDEDFRMVVFHSEGDPNIELTLDLPYSVVWHGPRGNVVLAGDDYLEMKALDRAFRVSADSFFQVNNAALDELVRVVIDTLNPLPNEIILDLYAGVGLFSAFIVGEVGQLIAVEESPSACRDFEHNLMEFDNPILYEAQVESALDAIAEQPDGIIVDPPRSGLSKMALDGILEKMPGRIVYVSCDPATLARDAKRLEMGRYHLESIRLVDMFPQTFHIESVSLWRRGTDAP